ncbi:tyrosine-type recombinase/integrase [Chloroflexota bacterium]
MNKGDIHLQELKKYFDTYNRSDGKSPSTLRWYDQTLNMFLGWLIETGRPVTLASFDEHVVREFILYIQERCVNGHKMRVYSVNNRVRASRAFFNWLYRKGYTKTHLLQDVRPPRLPQLIVDTLSDEEIASIIASLNPSTMTGSRNIAIIAMLLDSGLRLSELAGLKVQYVHLEEQHVNWEREYMVSQILTIFRWVTSGTLLQNYSVLLENTISVFIFLISCCNMQLESE